MKVGKKDIDLIEVGKLFLLGTGVYLVYKHFLKKTETEEAAENVVKAQKKDIEILKTMYQPTYNLSYYQSLANQIYNSIAYSGAADDYTNTFNYMLKIKNPLDMAYTIEAYNVRQRYFFGIPAGFPEDLITSVSNELRSEIIRNPFTTSKVDLINKHFEQNNIKYRL
jgi:hypothetical protein